MGCSAWHRMYVHTYIAITSACVLNCNNSCHPFLFNLSWHCRSVTFNSHMIQFICISLTAIPASMFPSENANLFFFFICFRRWRHVMKCVLALVNISNGFYIITGCFISITMHLFPPSGFPYACVSVRPVNRVACWIWHSCTQACVECV